MKESTSLKKEANTLRGEGEKEEEASRSRREGKIPEGQRDEATERPRRLTKNWIGRIRR